MNRMTATSLAVNGVLVYQGSPPSGACKTGVACLPGSPGPAVSMTLRAFSAAASEAGVEMVEAILKDKKKILPCAAYLEGEYGVKGLYVGVPVKLGARGIEQVIEIKLTTEEKTALEKSVASVRELVTILGVA